MKNWSTQFVMTGNINYMSKQRHFKCVTKQENKDRRDLFVSKRRATRLLDQQTHLDITILEDKQDVLVCHMSNCQ